MAKITLTYPTTGLSINIDITNRTTGVLAFSGQMTEIGTTGVYKFDFIEEDGADYIYTSFSEGYNTINGVIYSEVVAGLTTEQSEQLSRIDTKVDIPVSDSIGSYGRQVIDYTRIDKKIEETFEDIKKDIQEIQPTDITDIVSELESIKKTMIPKVDKTKELTISKLEQIEKKIDNQIKESEAKKLDFIKETDKIVHMLQKEDDKEEEIKTIIKTLDEEEIESIIKLLK